MFGTHVQIEMDGLYEICDPNKRIKSKVCELEGKVAMSTTMTCMETNLSMEADQSSVEDWGGGGGGGTGFQEGTQEDSTTKKKFLKTNPLQNQHHWAIRGAPEEFEGDITAPAQTNDRRQRRPWKSIYTVW